MRRVHGISEKNFRIPFEFFVNNIITTGKIISRYSMYCKIDTFHICVDDAMNNIIEHIV